MIYNSYKAIVNKMNEKLQTLYLTMCELLNEISVKDMDQAGGPGSIDPEQFDVSLLDLDQP